MSLVLHVNLPQNNIVAVTACGVIAKKCSEKAATMIIPFLDRLLKYMIRHHYACHVHVHVHVIMLQIDEKTVEFQNSDTFALYWFVLA